MIPRPVVLIISETEKPPVEIAKCIIEHTNVDIKTEPITNPGTSDEAVAGLLLHLTTKYYKTELLLVPFENDLSLLPKAIVDRTEAVLVYFDAKQKSFRNRIPFYSEFLEANNIELGILLCEKLCDDTATGITYAEARQHSNVLDVVELEKSSDESEAYGMDELNEIFKNFIWSNVNIVHKTTTSASPQKLTDSPADENPQEASNSEDANIENEMTMFENLLSEMMMYKNASANLTRNERLLYAENFAEKFDKLLEISSDEDN